MSNGARYFVLAALALAAPAGTVRADEYAVDPAHAAAVFHVSHIGLRPTRTSASSASSSALVASRTRSLQYGIGYASSKSSTPHTSRPNASRQVPKLAIWRSPIARTVGEFARSLQTVGHICAHR